MRQSVILPEEYEHTLLREAEKSGLVNVLSSPADELYDPIELRQARDHYGSILDRKASVRQNIFRMLLLFDEIIIDAASPGYDYQQLMKSGAFNIIPFEEFYYNNAVYKDGHSELAAHLKPVIVPVAEKDLRSYFHQLPENFDFHALVSDLYDYTLLETKIPRKYYQVLEQNRALFNARQQRWFVEIAQVGGMSIDNQEKHRFLSDITGHILNLYESLCW